MKALILSIFALAVIAAGTGKRNYEWPHATQWYGYFTQDSSGGVTQAVSKTVAESTLTGDGFALKRNIGDTLTANVRGWQTASGHVDSARAAYKADTAKTAAFAYAATYGDTSRAAKVADSTKKLPVAGIAGTYRSVTTDAYGRVVSGTTPTTLGPGYGVSYNDTVLTNHYLPTVGVTDGSTAAAGKVGEVIESKVAYAAGVALTTGVATNVTSIVLTAGDWEISGQISFGGTSITVASGTYSWGGVSTTSATFPADGTESGAGVPPMTATSSYWGICYAPKRVTVSASTTCYLVAFTQFTAGTVKAYGFIHARRVR
jgi:hypothetical protein